MQTFEQTALLAEGFALVPIALTLPIGGLTPQRVFLKLKNLSRQCFILDSAENSSRHGRYTFLGYDPGLEFTAKNGEITINGGTAITLKSSDPSEQIRSILAGSRSPRAPGLPPFTGGLVGYFSYDYIKYSEPQLELGGADLEGFKDVDLMLFDKVIAFDFQEGTIYLIENAKTDALRENYNRAVAELQALAGVITNGEAIKPKKLSLKTEFKPLFDRPRYCEMVETGKHYIHEGDIFQVVLSNSLTAEAEGSLFDTYGILRETNPSPYMFYFSSDDIEIAGAAPETLVKLQNGVVSTFPLAGTKPRGKTPEEDAAYENELLSDPKERAEHNMLVDLGRNDIGKISNFGTVNVAEYMTIEKFSHVMHIGSTVNGEIRADCEAVDAIAALLPAGTLSGAPKIRACEIIGELEGNRRGIYGGAIGYLAFNGDMDTCIAIRIAFKKNGKIFVRSGAGIVADSVAETEFDECINKAKAVVNAVKEASK
ncbi:MAG: anthranilate synthase component I family protein [Oscillospiraceae bacterium]|jgi:anthranilate synthase component 1|nr:anthranilate synthase component I family protein [Oscillospiraceae bacterium]